MHRFAEGYFVFENELVKKINLYLAGLDFTTATLWHVQSLSSPISPTIHAAAMELNSSKGK